MIPSFLLKKENIQFKDADENKKLSFIDKTINNAVSFISSTFLQWETAKKSGLFQLLDSRVKVIFLLLFVLLVSFTGETEIQFIITCFLFLLCVSSRLNIVHIYKRILATGFVFGFLIFIPASLNIFTNGENAFTILHFAHPHNWWIYNIPQDIAVTNEGIKTVIRLTLKVINSVTIVLLVIYTTTFERIVKSLSILKIPDIFLLTLTLTYKFIFILSNTIIETYRAIKMRWWNRAPVKDVEKIISGRIGFLFRKSWERYDLVYQSMIARGFNGKVNFYYFDKLKLTDYLFIIVFLLLFSCLTIINYFHAGNI
jgi:cobalt/nickel transport system permease protein